jgi:predicted acylesterase/phospholipase RssA
MSRLFRAEKSIASYQGLQEFLEKRTVEKFQQYFTLSQLLDRTGKSLVCSTYNVTQRKMEYLSPSTHPDLPCITAIRMSSALPFLFEPFMYMNSVYIDGGVYDDFPLSQIDPALGAAFAIRVVTTFPETDVHAQSLIDYLNLLFLIFKQNMQTLSLELSADKCEEIFTLLIDKDMSMYRFSLTTTQKFDLFSKGYETTQQVLEISDKELL